MIEVILAFKLLTLQDFDPEEQQRRLDNYRQKLIYYNLWIPKCLDQELIDLLDKAVSEVYLKI